MSAFERGLPHQSSLAYVPASARARDAVRYRCPTSGSFILLTDPVALRRLATRPVRCAGCGGNHWLMAEEVDSAA